MLIEKTNIFFSQHGIEKDVWSQMFYTTSRRTKSTKGSMTGKNEKIAPNINLFSKAIKGKHKITWKISDRDFVDTLVTTIFRTLKKDFYNFCKENLENISDVDTDKIDEEMIYNMIRSLATKIKAESYDIPECKNKNPDYIESGIAFDLNDNVKLLTNMKPCRSVFKGRDGLILQMYDHFQMKNHFLFLQGIGGIGKSECAKQFAEKYKNKYDVIVFSECPDSIVSSVNDNSIFTLTEPFIPKNSIESDRQFYDRKLKQLKILKEKILIILDNVDYFSEEIDDFLTLPFDIIITTRYDYFSEYPGQTIHINEIENMMILKDIFSEYYGKNVSNDPFTEKIINMFEHHTMAIELVAKQAKASNLTPQEIFDIMNNGDEYEFQETFRVMNYDQKQLNISSYMQKLFNIASLNKQEQYIMMCLSLLPLTGMEKRTFKNCCSLKDYNIINKLIELSWIRDIDGKLSIHTLIKETIKIFCKPDLIKCKNFINGLMNEFTDIQCLYEVKAKKDEVERIAMHIYHTFPEPILEMYDFYEWFGLITLHCKRYDVSLEVTHKLFNIYNNVFGNNHFRTAKMLCRIGCNQHNLYNLKEALKILEDGRKILLNLKNRSEGETLYISDVDLQIARTLLDNYNLSGNTVVLNKIEKLSQEMISIRQNFKGEIDDPLYLHLVDAYYDLACVYLYRHNYEMFYVYFDKIKEECQQQNSGYCYFFLEYLKVRLAKEQGNLQDAIKNLHIATKRHADYFGTHCIMSVRLNIELGDLYEQTKNTDMAYTYYQKALKYMQYVPLKNKKIHTYLTERIKNIENK